MTTTADYIAKAMTAVLEGDTDRAIGLLFRATLAYDDAISDQAAAEEEHDDLPPMRVLNRKKLRAVDVKCPLCKAKPGQPCVKTSMRGGGSDPLGTPLSSGKHHKQRRAAANEASDG